MPYLLLLEDHALSRVNLRRNLQREGFTVTACGTGGEALACLQAAALGQAPAPQVAILDLGLPDMDGLDVMKLIRGEPALQAMAVLVVSARDEVVDRILGLEFGADDYLTKPYVFRELMARIRAVSRRSVSSAAPGSCLQHGALIVNLERFTAWLDGVELDLPRKEFELLAYLVRHQGRVLSRQQLLREVWAQAPGIGERTVDVHIRRLRSKLGAQAGSIATLVGQGYRLD